MFQVLFSHDLRYMWHHCCTGILLNDTLPTCHANRLMQGVPCTGTHAEGLIVAGLCNNSMARRVSCACCSGVLQGGEVTEILVEAALDGLAAQRLICPALQTPQVGQVNGACAALADYRAVRSTEHCMKLVVRRC